MPKKKHSRFFGCHVSVSGGLANGVRNGQALGVNTIQIHATPPQRWNTKPPAQGIEAEFLELLPASGIERVFFHGIYLINLANPEPQQFHLSKTSLVNTLNLLSRMRGDGVVFHLGSMKDQSDETEGLKQVADGINWVLERTPADSRLILEVAAGGGKVIGDRLEELAEVYRLVDAKERVGFGLDSQHLWASGYDLQNELDKFVEDVDKIFSLEKVWAIHLNDSKTELGSRRDRHENIGDGLIGMEALKRFFLHPKLASIPFILETPAMKELAQAAEEVKKLRAMLN